MKNLDNRGLAPLAIILIVAGVLVLGGGGIYLYQKSNIKNKNSQVEVPAQNQQQNANNQISETQPIDVDATDSIIFAKTIISIEDAKDKSFTFSYLPDVKFKIKMIAKATGEVPVKTWCYPSYRGIFYKWSPGGSPSGYCFGSEKKIDDVEPSLIVVVLTVYNNSSKTIGDNVSDFSDTLLKAKIFYEKEGDGEKVTKAWSPLYHFPPFSEETEYLSFTIPSNQDEFRLSFGNFPADPRFGEKDYIINFKDKTFSEIAG